MDYIKLIAGLVLLIFSGDYLVKGGVSIAKRLRISSLVIGMTVVAFGTSAPELLVSLQAALKGVSEIAVGNVIGSNIANIALILGVTALVYPLSVSKLSIIVDWPFMMVATVLFTICAIDGNITRQEGILGFLLLVGFVIFQIYYSRKNNITVEEEEDKPISVWLAALYIIGSSFGLAFGANLLIESASNIATSFGVSQRIIGVTVVAFGTSLPELATSVAAALKKETDIAIGNIIGSNIFNIFCVIGLTSAITPISLNWDAFRPDFIWMIAIAFILILLILPIRQFITQKKHDGKRIQLLYKAGKLGRVGGIILFAAYIYYIVRLF